MIYERQTRKALRERDSHVEYESLAQ